MMPTVYTYHEDAETNQHEQGELLGLWHENWSQAGWEPKRLSLEDALKSPLFQALHLKAMSLPTINPKRYEVSCFHRWAALHAVGGGLMTDYDVFNNDFPPFSVPPGLTCYQWENPCPSAISGDHNAIARWIALIVEYEPTKNDRENGKLHVSDQTICQARDQHFLKVEATLNCMKDGWEKAPLIHFSQGSCYPHGGKLPCIRRFLESKKS